jgi:hypothetical protein
MALPRSSIDVNAVILEHVVCICELIFVCTFSHLAEVIGVALRTVSGGRQLPLKTRFVYPQLDHNVQIMVIFRNSYNFGREFP